ncbi:MAG TPA: efflux transporter outer membrane subunit [Bryobacteraceae bacterium]|jgi:NodT family efflux transporter outer membrane factor (OMF) lipoprotein|nr:efflux transporter outer membrane subunit [Bryobacteraceae bacterium]
MKVRLIRVHRLPIRPIAVIAALAFLSACNPGPKYSRPPAPAPTAYKEAPPQFKEGAGWVVAQPGDDKIRPKWWEMYNDPQLNALEQQVAISNQTVIQAEANFRAARSLVVEARSQLFPTIGGTGSYTREHFSSNTRAATVTPTGTTAGTSATINQYSVAADVSYTLDLWHRVRNQIAANSASAQASAADVATALLTTQAELAQDYFEVRALDAQEGILQDTLKNYGDALKLTTILFKTGIDSDQDVSQAQTQLDTATAQATDLGVARAQYEHAIATLIGKPAATFELPVAPFVPKPPPVPVGVPSELLQRRPDIAAAERMVASSNALIGYARGAYYPSLSLSASGGFLSSAISNWFTWPSRVWSLGPSVSDTLLDFGARRGAVEQAEATYDADVASYRQTVLSDFQTVEDNLASLRILATEVEQYGTAVQASAHYLALALTRYRTGVDSYLNVITAQNTLLSNRESQVQVQLRQMTSSVALIMALGGGWDASQLPEYEQFLKHPPKWSPAGAPPGVQPTTVAAPNPPAVPALPLPGAAPSPFEPPSGSKNPPQTK